MKNFFAPVILGFALLIGLLGFAGTAGAATGEQTPDYSISSTQSVWRSGTDNVRSSVQGEVRDGSQGTTRGTFQAKLDKSVTCPATVAGTDYFNKGMSTGLGAMIFDRRC